MRRLSERQIGFEINFTLEEAQKLLGIWSEINLRCCLFVFEGKGVMLVYVCVMYFTGTKTLNSRHLYLQFFLFIINFIIAIF